IILGVFILYFVQRQNMHGQLPDLSMKQPSDNTNNQMIDTKETALQIPPLLKDHDPDPNKAEFHLNAQNAKKENVPGKKYKKNSTYKIAVIKRPRTRTK